MWIYGITDLYALQWQCICMMKVTEYYGYISLGAFPIMRTRHVPVNRPPFFICLIPNDPRFCSLRYLMTPGLPLVPRLSPISLTSTDFPSSTVKYGINTSFQFSLMRLEDCYIAAQWLYILRLPDDPLFCTTHDPAPGHPVPYPMPNPRPFNSF